MNKNGGFTLVELLVAILISSIVVGLVGTMLSFNIKSFKSSRETMDVQYESQMAINQLNSLFSEATSIESIMVNDGLLDITYDSDDLDNLVVKSEVVRIILNSDFLENDVYVNKQYILDFNKADKKIINSIDSETYELSRNVSNFWIEPINGTMKTANLFELSLEFDNNGRTISLNQQVKMRNKSR